MIDEKNVFHPTRKKKLDFAVTNQRTAGYFSLLFFFAVGYFAVSCHYWASDKVWAAGCFDSANEKNPMRQLHKMVRARLNQVFFIIQIF